MLFLALCKSSGDTFLVSYFLNPTVMPEDAGQIDSNLSGIMWTWHDPYHMTRGRTTDVGVGGNGVRQSLVVKPPQNNTSFTSDRDILMTQLLKSDSYYKRQILVYVLYKCWLCWWVVPEWYIPWRIYIHVAILRPVALNICHVVASVLQCKDQRQYLLSL